MLQGSQMLSRIITPKEVRDSTISSNSLSIIIPAPDGQSIHIAGVYLTGTTGGGGAESITIDEDATTIHSESFTVGSPKSLLGTEGISPIAVIANNTACTITASATALSAGVLRVLYYLSPAEQ